MHMEADVGVESLVKQEIHFIWVLMHEKHQLGRDELHTLNESLECAIGFSLVWT